MKNLKKLLVVFFFTVAVSLFALAYAASAEEVKYPVDGGYLYFDTDTGTITGAEGGIENLDIPAEINGVEVTTVHNWVFEGKWSLKSVNIPATVKDISGFAFYECKYIESITVDDANPYFCDVDGVLFNSDITEIIAFPSGYPKDSYALPKTVTRINGGAFIHVILDVLDISSVTKLAESAFVNFDIQNMYANADLTEYYVNYKSFMEDVYYYRGTKLYNVYFTGDSYGPWKDILKSFGENYICNFEGKIESYPLDSGKIYYNSLTGTITGAENVWNLDIPEEINGTKIVAIAERAFAPYVGYQQETEYYSFNRVTIPGSVEKIGNYTFYCANINELIICDGVKEIGDYAFKAAYGNKRLKNLTIPDSVTYIGESAFEYNNGLTSLTIPGSVKTIGYGAFNECMNLKTLILEDGIETIGKYAFCYNIITELVIPQSVKSVEAGAFEMCDELRTVTYYSSTDINKTAFNYCYMLENINVIEVEPEPTVSVDGLHLIVHNLDGVKDYFIAKGEYSSYKEIKANYVMRVTAARINGADEYTYTLKEPGYYTVYVRYQDGTKEPVFLYENLSVTMPEFEIEGLGVTVSNLEDIKVIRTAPGVWTTAGEVKRAEGNRNFTANGAIKGAESYTVIYPEDGEYTISVEYYNGLSVVKTVTVEHKEPEMVQNGNSVTFGNLDDLYVIRYVKGEYATSYEIKRAEGANYRKPRDIVDGVITIDGLEEGIYTFCVQYNDQNCNYYTVVVE